MKEEVEQSYNQDIVLELRSDKIEDMQNNIDTIAERIKAISQ